MVLALAIAFLTVPFLTLAPAYADDTAAAAGEVTATEVVDPPPDQVAEEPPAEEPAAEEPVPTEPAPEAQEAPAPQPPSAPEDTTSSSEESAVEDTGKKAPARTSKTDAGTLAAPIQQAAANCSASFSQNTQEDAGGAWINGNLIPNNSDYAEGDFVPQRVLLDGLTAGEHTLTFSFDRTKDSKFAYDYVAHLAIEDSAGATADWSSATANFAGPAPVGTVADYPGTNTVFVTITFTIADASDATATLRWDGHIASEIDYGTGNSASEISGSPYHFSLVDMSCGNVGQQDNQLQAAAIQFGTIVVVKDAVPNSATAFDFDLDALNNLHDDFALTDDGVGTDNTYSIHVPPGAVTVTETPVAGWNLTDITCTVPGQETATSVTVSVADHATVTCTFTNSRTSTLEVDKLWVINGGAPVAEGSAAATALGLSAQLTVDGDNEPWNTALSGYLQGTTVTLDESVTFGNDLCDWAGTTHGSVTEVNGEAPADGTLPHDVALSGGDNHATITNEVTCDGALVLRKVVDNTNGGTAVPGDFTLVASPAGGGADLSTQGSSEGHTLTVTAGATYDLSETGWPLDSALPEGYSLAGIDCGAGEVASIQVPAGETRICTFTNEDSPGSLTLVKVVDHNGTGDDAEEDDWTLTADPRLEGEETISGTTGVSGATKAGTYDLSEDGPTGYDASTWSCLEGNTIVPVTDASVTLGMGQDVTCTITNTAKWPHLTLVKIVAPENAQDGPEEFTLTATPQSGPQEPLSGPGPIVEDDVMVGTYDLSESGPAGYDPSEAGWQCVNATQQAVSVVDDAVAVAVGDSITCTIVNVAVPATVEVDKYWSVNGGEPVLDGELADAGYGHLELDAQLLVSGNEHEWSTPIGGFLRGAPISLDEQVTVGNDLCRSTGGKVVESHGSTVPPELGGLPYADTVLGGTNHYTILNTVECASELTLVKVVDPGETGDETPATAFTLSADPTLEGEPTLTGEGGASSAVTEGDFVLSETGPTTYSMDLAGWKCEAGEDDLEVAASTVTVPLATSVTCTIINRAIPSEWTVAKSSNPPSGSTVQPGEKIDYTLTLTKVGNGVPVEGITVTDTLTGVEDGWVSGLEGEGASISGGVITWPVAELGTTPLTLTYTVTVGEDAWNSEIDNVVTPGPVPCLDIDGEECDHTEHFTPHYTLDKAVALLEEPGDGDDLAEPGERLEYTLTIVNDTEHAVVDTVIIDNVADVVDNAEIISLGDNLSYDEDTDELTWTVENLGHGETLEVTYVVEINDGAWGVTLRNVATPVPDDGGECVPPGDVPGGTDDNDECETTTETPPVTTMVVEKRDLESDEVLAGATFQVWSLGPVPEGGCDFSAEPGAEGQLLVGTAVTEGDGQALFHDLQHGCYLLVETVAPAGYELPEDAVMGVQIDELNFVEGGEMSPIVVTDFAEGQIAIVAKRQFERIGGEWVESDGKVSYGDTVRYVVRVAATGPKNFHDVTVTDYVPGFNPDDTVSTLDGTLVEGSAVCAEGLTCTTSVDPTTQLVTWDIGDLEPDAGATIGGTAVMDVVFPEAPVDVILALEPEETFTSTLWNVGFLEWDEAVQASDAGEVARLARSGGGAGAQLASAAMVELPMVHHQLTSNEVVVTASITAPPETIVPGRTPRPQGSPLPQTGAPAGILPLALAAVILVGAGLRLTRRKEEE